MDGGARGNPGPAAVGVSICHAASGQPVHEAGYFLGITTNNVAEYEGLVRALERAERLGATAVELFSDSELMVKQIRGEYRVKSTDLKPLYDQARERLQRVGDWSIQHVRRESNQRADELANQAMDAQRDVIVLDGEADPQQPAETDAPEPVAQMPRWKAKLMSEGCLTSQPAGVVYQFGPWTAEGFCIHAAAAMLSDGPLQWPADRSSGRTACKQCGLKVAMKRI